MTPQLPSQRRRLVLPSLPSTPLEEAWQAFYKATTAGRAEATKGQHEYVWHRTEQFCKDHGINEVSDWTDALAYEFGEDLKSTGLSKATVHRHLMILHRWLRWAKVNPNFEINRFAPKETDTQSRKRLTEAELTKLFSVNLSVRDRFLLTFLLGTGLRLSEVFAPEQGLEAPLILDNISDQFIEVKGIKTGDRRIVGMQEYLWRDYQKYLPKRPESTYKAVFLNNRQDHYNGVNTYLPMTISSVKTLMRRLRVRTGIDGLHAHALRHTYAFQAVDNGVSLPVLMKQLGHHKLSTTQIYLGLDSQVAAEMVISKNFSRPSYLS